MNFDDAERTIQEHIGSPVLQAITVILEDELEKAKNSLLRLEDGAMRGQGQMCQKLMRRFSRKDVVDTEE